MYTKIIENGTTICIKRDIDGAFIPENKDNQDYMEYLQWIDEGNSPKEEHID